MSGPLIPGMREFDRPRSRRPAWAVGTIPCCSPSAPISRIGLRRICSLIRGELRSPPAGRGALRSNGGMPCLLRHSGKSKMPAGRIFRTLPARPDGHSFNHPYPVLPVLSTGGPVISAESWGIGGDGFPIIDDSNVPHVRRKIKTTPENLSKRYFPDFDRAVPTG